MSLQYVLYYLLYIYEFILEWTVPKDYGLAIKSLIEPTT